jgi:hypothetical protein
MELDSFILELLRRKDNFSQKLVELSPSNSNEARELRQLLDEQLVSTEELIELYRKQQTSDPLQETVRLVLTVSFVSNPAIRHQLAEALNDDHKINALLDFWDIFNGNKGDTFQTVFARSVEYVELLRRGSEVLAPNSSTSLKSLYQFVRKASEWLADKSKPLLTKKDISVSAKENQLNTSHQATSIVPSKPEAYSHPPIDERPPPETEERPADVRLYKSETQKLQPTENKLEAPKRKSWADEEDDVIVEESKHEELEVSRVGEEIAYRKQRGRNRRNYTRERYRRRY